MGLINYFFMEGLDFVGDKRHIMLVYIIMYCLL
jgi:hypothetical protein